MDTQSALNKATRPGWRTSEFWISLFGIFAALAVPQADTAVAKATDAVSAHGAAGMIAAGAIAGAYAVGRSLVKAQTAKAAILAAPDVVSTAASSTPNAGVR